MATQAQIAANRANAQLSTGPSPAGIENCRHNATKNGLTGKQVVIKGENAEAYDALRAKLVAQYNPATEQEAMLTEEIAQCWWRHERAVRTESEMLESIGLAAAMNDCGFLNLQKYMGRIERCYNRARKDLLALQELGHEQKKESTAVAVTRSFVRSLPAIGSVLSKTDPPAPTPAPAPSGPAAETGEAVNTVE